jgi:hypothetical protein
MTVKIHVGILALIGVIFGLSFVLAPEQVGAVYGIKPSPDTELTARLFGGAAVRGVLIGNGIGHAVSLVVAVMGVLSGVMNAVGWSSLLIYLFGAAGSAYFPWAGSLAALASQGGNPAMNASPTAHGGQVMRAFAIILMSLISVGAAQAADNQGEDSYTIDYVTTVAKTIKAGRAEATLLEFSGISRNDKGSGMFNHFGAHCLAIRQSVGPSVVSRGTCVDSDPDGDQIFSTFEARAAEGKPVAGTHEFVGGTGKYAGITGTADYAVQPLKSPDGTGLYSVQHKAKWRIPAQPERAVNEPGSKAAILPAAFVHQTGGTADEAKAMLERAVAAVEADKAKAIDMFNKGEGGFLDRDLYVFCSKLADGEIVAIGNPNAKHLLGKDTRALTDPSGKVYGREIFDGEHRPEGEVTEVRYLFQRPGADETPVPKVSLVTKAGDLGCGVGYYKQ